MRILPYARRFANSFLRPCGYVVHAVWELDFCVQRTFVLNETEFPYFFHSHNCGWPPFRTTERTVELAIADLWLNAITSCSASLCEIGAVTPYYWPGRIRHVVDPTDQHPQVNVRDSLFSFDFSGCSVLSISTLEHVGLGDYGLQEQRTAIDALLKVVAEADRSLITFPVGYNSALDQVIRFPPDVLKRVRIYAMVRQNDNAWIQADIDFALNKPYGPRWANAIIIIEDGSILNGACDDAGSSRPSQVEGMSGPDNGVGAYVATQIAGDDA